VQAPHNSRPVGHPYRLYRNGGAAVVKVKPLWDQSGYGLCLCQVPISGSTIPLAQRGIRAQKFGLQVHMTHPLDVLVAKTVGLAEILGDGSDGCANLDAVRIEVVYTGIHYVVAL